ncbi:T6SS immunity protein Tli4 family protein [Uliginosibacterium sp. sgz301328]|uniref:T6SS immunity protein Tli4 family protein n=1 Tax=Uliginosibacterium sp. sgz301328 TaxID=3243764 RepID=UPI00359DA53A
MRPASLNRLLAALLAILLLAACANSPKTGTPTMLNLDSTFCFGYHQISVPANAKTSIGQPIVYDQYKIRTHLHQGKEGYAALIRKEEKYYAPPGMDGEIIRDSRELFPGGHAVVIGMKLHPENTTGQILLQQIGGIPHKYSLYRLLPQNFTVYEITGPDFILKFEDDENTVLNKLYQESASFLQRISPRKDLDVPAPDQRGVCIDSGFIADANDGLGEHFFKTPFTFVTFPDLPGVEMRISVNVGVVKPGGYLFDRKPASSLAAMLDFFKFRTLRKAERTVNGVPGQEILTAWTSDAGPQFLFIWESTENPRLKVEVDWGHQKDDSMGSRNTPSPVSTEQAMAIWDAMLPTLKERSVKD